MTSVDAQSSTQMTSVDAQSTQMTSVDAQSTHMTPVDAQCTQTVADNQDLDCIEK
ncbi:hypothetical protein DPMN_078860 [Dreissena polymorpha]|uniref:Uncharacterized protein n=1 Tax=Dreissena polymorpha TaxID=45954 RepID=A0A9D3YTB9_DREPO|nr:hypothetical protein DPMN_078860 [Dreissena polymorpha]